MTLPTSPKLLARMREAIRLRHFSPRTEEAYVGWVRRYVRFHGMRHPGEMGEAEATRFLWALASERRVSASTQNQALAALEAVAGEAHIGVASAAKSAGLQLICDALGRTPKRKTEPRCERQFGGRSLASTRTEVVV